MTNTDVTYTPREACDKVIVTLGGIIQNEKLPGHIKDLLVNLRELCLTSFEHAGSELGTAGASGSPPIANQRRHAQAGH